MTLDLDELVVRLGAAAAAGVIIGLNRDINDKPIGMRTLGLVALGAAVVAVATIQISSMAEHPDAMSRVVQGIIQGIMTGISFIGAGVVLRDHSAQTVRGLTTAATVWIAAALGIACGLGAWRTVAVALVIALFLLIGLAWIERLFGSRQEP